MIYLKEGNRGWGIIASKKVGSAVSRNRAKRLLREYMRTNVSKFYGKEVLLIARRDLIDRTLGELSQSLEQMVQGEINA
ncbi:MAG TPA: ribonuclease P protein component [Bdellovibrionota bacterium]|nr:ribonuclease P protein component [Bdellovibrionota bacterium]